VITAATAQIVGVERVGTAMSMLWMFNIPGLGLGPGLAGIMISNTGSYLSAIMYGGSVVTAAGQVLLYPRSLNRRLLAVV
jgi:hypothetical protein